MEYLIKDLSRLTGINGHTIRKWNERYKILSPRQAENGYWYYSIEDFLILQNIQEGIKQGQKISELAYLGRKKLLKKNNVQESLKNWKFYRWFSQSKFAYFQKYFELFGNKHGQEALAKECIQPLLVLLGKGWEDGIISVAEEHAFAKWVFSYIYKKAMLHFQDKIRPQYLITVFPGDRHELGALLHYYILLLNGEAVHFIGSTPLEFILEELNKGNYNTISFSLTLPQTMESMQKLETTIISSSSVKTVLFGGYGYKKRKNKFR
ncbi:MAG: MerR family transcriptional regulator [Leptospiraceae bacterium]|nr:MerR family transcriptional regulator [Leptospiraceae bacterium]